MKLKPRILDKIAAISTAAIIAGVPDLGFSSSHMDAPLITLDDAANTTDVYAFKSSRDGADYLTVALSVYPFEVPGVGPNKYNFDDNVRYSIHVGTGDDVAKGKTTIRYDIEFKTNYKNEQTILQSYLGVIENVDGPNQNLTQTYEVSSRTERRGKKKIVSLGEGVVPPNNQGIATPYYNQGDDGEQPEKAGVDDEANLDRYTSESIAVLDKGYRAFAGQREDGFYGDIQSIFDLLQLRSGGAASSFDSQSGFNVHTIALEIPLSEIGGPEQVVAVHASTSRPKIKINRTKNDPRYGRRMRQVGRQGNPLFCEAILPLEDKDLYNRTDPSDDADMFADHPAAPELSVLIDFLVFGDAPGGGDDGGIPDDRLTNRTDLAGIFIPDTIKVDLSTAPARLTGGGNDDADFSRLGIFGGDALTSTVQTGFFGNGTLPGGWPNGRRFGDDVIDIAVFALINDLRDPAAPVIDISADGIDNVSANDAIYNKVFPYAGTPHNGRNYEANPNYVNPGLPDQP